MLEAEEDGAVADLGWNIGINWAFFFRAPLAGLLHLVRCIGAACSADGGKCSMKDDVARMKHILGQ